MKAANAASVTDEALENLPSDGAESAYEIWRVGESNRNGFDAVR
jgi:hypothetical protein